MPLSEEELRLLEQMERALVAEDPKFASSMRGTSLRRSARRRAYAAGAAFLVGIAVLMTGAVTQQTIIGILGFVVMLAAAYIGLTALRGRSAAESATPPPAAPPRGEAGLRVVDGGRAARRPRRKQGASRSDAAFMQRLEERWRRRRGSSGF